MRLTITLEHRFESTPDGRVLTQTMFPYGFWLRYLAVFDQVNIVARTRKVATVPDNWLQVNGREVVFSPVPYYIGPLQYMLRAGRVGRAVRSSFGATDAVIMRVGSQIAACLEPKLRREKRPYGLEVVGDPYDVFAPGAVRHPLRFFFRWLSSKQLRRQCQNACAVAYVTESALQRRYPPSEQAYLSYFSSVELPSNAFAPESRGDSHHRPTMLIHVGTMNQLYKAQDILLKAMKSGLAEGLDLRLKFVGDGRHKDELRAQAGALGLGNRVEFLGQLSVGDAVRRQLDQADLFVLPSRTEGLPRSMIEAMARGLPCVGSTVGGIPELLPDDDLVPPNDPIALAHKICEVIRQPGRMKTMSVSNWQKAREYGEDVLSQRRCKFYQALRDRTEQWLGDRVMS